MTATDTATHPLLTNTDFLQMCEYWRLNNRCPFAVVDVLIEAGYEWMRPAAEWAVSEPDRRNFDLNTLFSGPTPRFSEGDWSWYTRDEELLDADDIPIEKTNEQWVQHHYFDTFPEAIVWFLTEFKPLMQTV